MAKWIKTDGSVIDVKPKNGTDFQLEELQNFVGGYIEIVYLRNGQILVVNEEGKLEGLDYNAIASMMYPDTIVGNVLLCDSDQVR